MICNRRGKCYLIIQADDPFERNVALLTSAVMILSGETLTTPRGSMSQDYFHTVLTERELRYQQDRSSRSAHPSGTELEMEAEANVHTTNGERDTPPSGFVH